jgi:UDP-N-acetylmuramate: L-alanyl-gamma-D-glutamyl-meso-diaminopimelate ligase
VLAGLHQPEKIPEPERLSVNRLVDAINGLGEERAVVIEKVENIAFYVAQNAVPRDIVIVMSNGGFGGVQDKILQALAG